MQALIKEIKKVQNSSVNDLIDKRLKEFASFRNKSNEEWFQELCFCILAANSKQKTAEAIEKSLGYKKLLSMPQAELALFIRNNKHRFHNNKSKFIVEARQYRKIKDIVTSKSELEAREWLVKNIKGIGLKESSHFLRNTGHCNVAILDRHILNKMAEYKIIEKPKTLSPKIYLEIEKKFNLMAKKIGVNSAKLDMLVWYLKTNEVLK